MKPRAFFSVYLICKCFFSVIVSYCFMIFVDFISTYQGHSFTEHFHAGFCAAPWFFPASPITPGPRHVPADTEDVTLSCLSRLLANSSGWNRLQLC